MNLENYPAIPSDIAIELENYVRYRKCPSPWLYAILTNNLIDTISNPHQYDLVVLFDIIRWLSNEIPENIWGSDEKVETYLAG